MKLNELLLLLIVAFLDSVASRSLTGCSCVFLVCFFSFLLGLVTDWASFISFCLSYYRPVTSPFGGYARLRATIATPQYLLHTYDLEEIVFTVAFGVFSVGFYLPFQTLFL